MSTKIYNAYHYVEDMASLMKWLFKLRNRHVKNTLELMRRLFSGAEPKDFGYIAKLIRDAGANHENSDLNIAASAVVFPDSMGRSSYVVFFGLDSKMLPKKHPFYDFHYQNSTDKPDNVEEDEWDHRRKVWTRLTKNGSTFSECGLVFSLVPVYFDIDIARHVCHKEITE